MSNIMKVFYNIQCDCCGCIFDEEAWRPEIDDCREDMGLWLELDGSDICPDCYHIDDNDNIVTKDGSVYDYDTHKKIE